jgi:hypothetical protein
LDDSPSSCLTLISYAATPLMSRREAQAFDLAGITNTVLYSALRVLGEEPALREAEGAEAPSSPTSRDVFTIAV